jgi:hypothetical protein
VVIALDFHDLADEPYSLSTPRLISVGIKFKSVAVLACVFNMLLPQDFSVK